MSGPPPPPPPHGEMPKASSGLPPGKYDIFVIPEHSAGSGFLYLPSLQPNANSFAAGFASALILVVLAQSMAPAFRTWWESFHGVGNMGMILLMIGIGFGAWALGRAQKNEPGHGSRQGHDPGNGSAGQSHGFGGNYSAGFGGAAPPPPHHNGSNSGAPGGNSQPPPPPPQQPGPEKPKPSWQQRSPPQPNTEKAESAKGSWQKAREETRRKEEERKAKEAEQKRREEAAKRLAELRAKEAKERQERDKEARERKEKLDAELKAKSLAAQLEKEKKERERLEKAAKEAKEAKEAQEREAAKSTTPQPRMGGAYPTSGVGEKTSIWPNGRPQVPSHSNPPSPGKRPPAPTAKTYLSTNDDAYSYRPYDEPGRSRRRRSVSSIGGSEASWAPSHTTARTSPPPSDRAPYSTKDPDKIVISAVYLFMNQFSKTPASQLISGIGSVTDGLILRITTEGLFIDDDVRHVPQREWDVKAWTLKNVEVWCPPHCLNAPSSSAAGAKGSPGLLHKMAGRSPRNNREGPKTLTGEDADSYLTEMLYACKNCCRLGLCKRTLKDTNIPSSPGQTGSWQPKGLHVLRATVRDQEGKRYVFVIDETESWKVAVGLQRLRRGTQVRQLGVSGLTPSEARGTLDMLGWVE